MMIITSKRVTVTLAMLEKENMTRKNQLGIPVNPENLSLGLTWMETKDIKEDDFDKLEAYFLKRMEQFGIERPVIGIPDQIMSKAEAMQKEMHAFIEQQMLKNPNLKYEDCRMSFLLFAISRLDNKISPPVQGDEKVIGISMERQAYDIIETAYLSFARLQMKDSRLIGYICGNGFTVFSCCPECRVDDFSHMEDCRLAEKHGL